MTIRSLSSIVFIVLFLLFAGCSQPSSIENALPDKEIANEISSYIKTIGPIDDSIFDDYSNFKDGIKKVNQLTRIINENIKTEIPEIGSTLSDFENFKGIKIALKYAPIIEPYNQLYESSIHLPSENNKDYEIFYSDLGKFSLEVCILESRLSYKIAFTTTGDLAYHFKLYNLIPYIGNEGYRILLSEIHWSIRENIENQSHEIVNFLINRT